MTGYEIAGPSGSESYDRTAELAVQALLVVPLPPTQGMGDNEDPTWSPDGRCLLISSTRNGKSQIWLLTADGWHQSRVTETGGWMQPSW